MKKKDSATAVAVHRKKGMTLKKSERITEWSFLGLSVAGVLVFYILPFLVVVFYSVVDNPINKKFVGLENFSKILHNDAFTLAARNTLIFSAVAVPAAVVLSIILALVLDSKIPFKSQLRASFLCPMMVPTASVVLIWQIMFYKTGTVNQMLDVLGIENVDWLKSGLGMVVVIIMFLWKNLGYNMILFLTALNNIPNDILEVATLEGAGPCYKFFHLKLRYLSPTILFVTILSLINSFKIFREVYLLTGDYPYDALYMLQHFMNNTFNLLEYQKLSSAAIIMSLVMIVIIAVLFVVEYWFGKDVE